MDKPKVIENLYKINGILGTMQSRQELDYGKDINEVMIQIIQYVEKT